MEKGRLAVYAALLIATTCAKPKLDGVADGVVDAMNDMSEGFTAALEGGFKVSDAKKCQQERITENDLALPTESLVAIKISPQVFELYTEEDSYTSFGATTLYKIDLTQRIFTLYEKTWRGWDDGTTISLPPESNEKFFSDLNSERPRTTLEFKNPFRLPRGRLGVGLGFSSSSIMGRDPTILLTARESRAVFCAAALNSYYEILLRTAHDFKK